MNQVIIAAEIYIFWEVARHSALVNFTAAHFAMNRHVRYSSKVQSLPPVLEKAVIQSLPEIPSRRSGLEQISIWKLTTLRCEKYFLALGHIVLFDADPHSAKISSTMHFSLPTMKVFFNLTNTIFSNKAPQAQGWHRPIWSQRNKTNTDACLVYIKYTVWSN